MSIGLVGTVTLLYLGVAFSEAVTGKGPMCVVFLGYAFANLGLIWGMMR